MNLGTNHPGLGLKDRKILLVTADHSKAAYFRKVLGPAGYQLAEVESSAEAPARQAQVEPDLVLLDLDLPGDAFELCRQLRGAPEAAPIIFVTSRRDPEQAALCLTAGGVEYLAKPFRKTEILARIRVHLRHRLVLAKLSKDDSAKTRLLSMAAHDLRNPLASIRALSDFLRDGTVGPLAPEQRALLNTIYDASHSMLHLVNELLDVSVIEAGELKLEPQPTALADLIDSCLRLNNALAAQKGSIIVRRPGAPLPDKLVIDGPRIGQVLNNLLGNAVKFSPPSSTITVETDCDPHQCTIAVCDQGPGIPEAERGKLFKNFSRTSVRPTGGESTTGLGLYIAKRIMLAHGGTILTENLPEGGACFRISIPVHP